MIAILFSISLFISAFLLFVIQPAVAKALLPVYGGAPAVWTVCMLFFQAVLFMAYSYTWWLSRFAAAWRWLHLGLIVLGLTTMPLNFHALADSSIPELAILKNLLLQLGLPLLIIASSAPLLQFAYSRTTAKHSADPYFLYAASNLGSLFALLSYPWLIEYYIGLTQQFYYWNFFFIIYLVLLMIVITCLPYKKTPTGINRSLISLKQVGLWITYSFIPCSLMLGMTFYVSADIAAAPLFWVLPLALYLSSFIITFAKRPLISPAWVNRNTLLFMVFPFLGFILHDNVISLAQLMVLHCLSFLMIALLCHGNLVASRPIAIHLPVFYVCIALGGVLAGVFNGLVAPRFFNGAYEYPLLLVLALFCLPLLKTTRLGFMPWIILALLVFSYCLPDGPWLGWLKKNHAVEIIALAIVLLATLNRLSLICCISMLLVYALSPWFRPNQVIAQHRNFYGIKQVAVTKEGAHVLLSQSTLHGLQLPNDKADRKILGRRTYYGPIAPAIDLMQTLHPAVNATIVGLGTGTMVCLFREQDKVKIIDIDEQVIDIAHTSALFNYLERCRPATVLQGDGRLLLAKDKQAALQDIIVLDAFSSDAIPVHLLTFEAVKLYQQKLKADGIILFNISNRHLQVLPVLVAAAIKLDMIILHKYDKGEPKLGQFPSEWVLLTTNQALASNMMSKQGWVFAAAQKAILWTDDYSNLIALLK